MSTQEQNTEPKPENTPAFPTSQDNSNPEGWTVDGMTLLDHFAAKCIEGVSLGTTSKAHGTDYYEAIAKDAYSMARAMLKERSKHV